MEKPSKKKIKRDEVTVKEQHLETFKKLGIKLPEFFQDDVPFDNTKFSLSEETEKYYQEGIKEEDLLKSKEFLEKAAEGGHPLAMHYLGNIYDIILEDKAKAREWYNKAADLGLSVSQYNLGLMYVSGSGGEVNLSKAFEFYTKAANQGFAVAQHNLAWMYCSGEGAEKDKKKAFEWYLKAAEQDDSKAQYNIGMYYLEGEYIEQDEEKAAEWFERSAKLGNTGAQHRIGLMYKNGEGVEENREKAFKYLKKAVEANYADAFVDYAVMLIEKGRPKQAKTLLTIAATKLGNTDAYFNLGVLFMEGGNFKKALSCFKVAADAGNEMAMVNAGSAAEAMGKTKMALKYYQHTALLGHAHAQWNLGLMYEDLPEHQEDLEKIRKLFEQAAAQDHSLANFRLGTFYYKGEGGVQKDIAKAIPYFEKCVTLDGNDTASFLLGKIYLGTEPETLELKDEEKAFNNLIAGAKNGNKKCVSLLKTLAPSSSLLRQLLGLE